MSASNPLPGLPRERVPAPVRRILATLEGAGHAAALVGGCVRDLVEGREVRDFDVATEATPTEALALLPRAVPTGLRHGTVTVPSPAGPVDVTRFRAGARLADDLAHRDFTLNALAWRLGSDTVLDLHGGLEDLGRRRLRAVGDSDARLAEDPLRAVRAARLLAERGFDPVPELVAAMARAADAVARVAPERLRAELERILLAPRAGDGLRLLRATGIESRLAGDLPERAAEVVDALPRRRDERLTGWLLATSPRPVLSRLRFSNAVRTRVERLWQEHPVWMRADPERPASLRRLLGRLEAGDAEALLDLACVAGAGGAEPPPEAAARTDALREALDRLRVGGPLALGRGDLALDGQEVMEILRTGPGPVIGDALRYLTECVIERPEDNEPGILRARLVAWRARREEACR